MRRTTVLTALAAALAAGSIGGGAWWQLRPASANARTHAANIYTCPMHPEYRIDHPGDCPMCGMRLEPEREGAGAAESSLPHGAVQVSPERQQAIGIRTGVVGLSSSRPVLRTTGRVVPDENRTYPIVAAVSGWLRNVETVTAGDAVKADQVLASFLAPQPEFDTAQQMYYTGLDMLYRVVPQPQQQSPSHDPGRLGIDIERAADGLRNMGVSNTQLRSMARRRELVQDIQIQSPVDGFVLKRGVSPGLRFDRGFEFYRIADLNRVWILADVYRDQLPFIRRGAQARITSPETSSGLTGTVSASEPVFDEATLTLKVRLEVANPRAALKPGMFVDVEFPVDSPPTLVVPADAIVDSGLHKTVYVDRGDGRLEPRPVETGWRTGDDIEVKRGLASGERIVISGTFLVDSESRMKAVASEAKAAKTAADPVCGMQVDREEARAAGRTATQGKDMQFFCSDRCKKQFVANPSSYGASAGTKL